MPATVTLMIFSGFENPTWQLDSVQVDEMRAILDDARNSSMVRPSGVLGGLGYTGFEIFVEREEDIEPYLYVHEDLVDLGEGNPGLELGGRALERWLLSTAPQDVVHQSLYDFVSDALGGSELYAGRTQQVARGLVAPRYDPSIWNADRRVRRNNNCYNYANNKITGTFAQPGRGSGSSDPNDTNSHTLGNCLYDGLEHVDPSFLANGAPAVTPIDGHFAALVVWPPLPGDSIIADFHFYRLDDDAWWSHKPGQTAARNTDNSGATISDPRSCNRGPYRDFVSFLHTFPSSISVR